MLLEMVFRCRSFIFGVIAGASAYATLRWFYGRRSRRKKDFVDDNDDCLLFAPKLNSYWCDERPGYCEYICCCACNYKKFLTLIENTRATLDICLYLITSYEVTQLILKLFRKGVYVRVIVDKQMSDEAQNSKMHFFIKEHIPIKVVEGFNEAIMHNKFMIIDHRKLITGSFNWTSQGLMNNFENGIIIHNKEIVQKFNFYFEHIWVMAK